MPTEFKPGCVRPKSTLAKQETNTATPENAKEEVKQMLKLGGPAPDFELAGYQKGSFKNFRLSELKGKWVVLCFYPGDFTFV